MSQNEYQVNDNFPLLEKMMIDLKNADNFYQPTNYWAVYEKIFLPELKKKGLKDFRRRRRSVLGSFGATDIDLHAVVDISTPFSRINRIAGQMLNGYIERSKIISVNPFGINPGFVTSYFHEYVRQKMERINLSINNCPTSLYGNPEDIVNINGNYWSLMHLQYCVILADFLTFSPINDGDVVLELGTGMGRNVEVMAHLFPKSTFFVVDIPPQLYVANQYLQSVFGSRVVTYQDAVELFPDDNNSLPEGLRGKIIILPTWRMPAWSKLKLDLFWNSASFQEMEPDVVKNYLQLACSMSPGWIYINALPHGNYWREWKPGVGGTKLPVKDDIYFDTLKEFYTLHQLYNTDYFLRTKDYKSYIFKRS